MKILQRGILPLVLFISIFAFTGKSVDLNITSQMFFSIAEMENCVALYCPIPEQNGKAYSEYVQYTNCLTDKVFESCRLCQQHKRSSSKSDFSIRACSECTFNCGSQINSINKVFRELVLSCHQECTTMGEMFFQPYSIKSLDHWKPSCFGNCSNCTTPACKNDFQMFEKCMNNSAQCRYASKEFEEHKHMIYYPYPLQNCKMACIPQNRSDEFIQSQNCIGSCQGVVQINKLDNYFNHTVEKTQYCIKKYMPMCPHFDKECQKEMDELKECQMNFENQPLCNMCQYSLRMLNTNYGLMPKTCFFCLNTCYKNPKSQVFQKYMIKALQSCYMSGEFNTSQTGYYPDEVATKKQYQTCLLDICNKRMNCHFAANKTTCIRDSDAYMQCQEQELCKYAQNEFSQQDPNSILQYPFYVCHNACVQYHPQIDEDFEKNVLCWDFCMTNVFTEDGMK